MALNTQAGIGLLKFLPGSLYQYHPDTERLVEAQFMPDRKPSDVSAQVARRGTGVACQHGNDDPPGLPTGHPSASPSAGCD